MTLVSIITPSYNQADFLEQTIQSVLRQDYTQIEYIVVDGGSTDGSLQIIEKHQGKLAWWVSEPDTGQADAINKGLARASGEYVAWLNSDDLYLPGAIGQAVSALQTHPLAGLVFGDAITIDSQGRQLNRLIFGDYRLAELMGFRMICQPAVFMRRACLEQAGFLDLSYHYLLDHHLWLRMARLAPIQHVNAPWAAARHHPSAKNVAQASGFGDETSRLLDWMKNQPELAHLVAGNLRGIEAGAFRLRARYLLDGDQPGPALRSYLHALRLKPAFALKHWHRMIYALLSLAGGRRLAAVYYRLRQAFRSVFYPGDAISRR